MRSAERRVTALITRPGPRGPELLCFEHPAAGVQLPAGTVGPGESFAAAAVREAWGVTGALGLEPVREVGTVGWRREDRHLVHLRATIEMPEAWRVITPVGGGTTWWCFWAPIDRAHELLHEHQRDGLDAARAGLVASASTDPPPRPRPALPEELAGPGAWEEFWAPAWPFDQGGRRFAARWVVDLPDIDVCTRARAICVVDGGEVVVVRDAVGWSTPGGGREPGESVAENLARELWEEARARVVDTRFLAALRGAELDRHGRVCSGIDHHAVFWARVELDRFEPSFEIAERRVLPAREAADLLMLPSEYLLDLAAAVDPRLDWKAGDE